MTPIRWVLGALLGALLAFALTPLLRPTTIGDAPSPASLAAGFSGGEASDEARGLELRFDDAEEEERSEDDSGEDGLEDDVLPVFVAEPAIEPSGQVAPVQPGAPALPLPGGCGACRLEVSHPARVSEVPVGLPEPSRRRWLVRHQDKVGIWSAGSWRVCGVCCAGPGHDPGEPTFDVAVTGTVLLAFVGNGHTHRFGSFRRTVKKALKWLRAEQAPWGQLGHGSGPEAWRNHLLGAYALSELYACSRDFTLRSALRRASAHTLETVLPGLEEQADPRLAGWLILACRSVKGGGGAEVPAEVWPRLRRLARQDSADPLVASVGVLAHLLSGEGATGDTRRAAERLAATLPRWEPEHVDLERWFFTSYALYLARGEPWKAWHKALTKALQEAQREGGCQDGSWDPIGVGGRRGGRVQTTALAELCLEVYYRYERSK